MRLKPSGRSRHLTATLAMVFALMSMAALLVSGSIGLFFLFQSQQDAIADEQQLVAQQAAMRVAGFLQEKFSVMDAAVRLTRSGEERQRALQVLLGLQPAFRQLLLLNVKNEVLFRVSRMSKAESARLDRQLGDDPFSWVKAGRRYIGTVNVDQVTSEPLIIMAVPVTTILGEILGVLVAEVNLKFMWDLVDQLKVGESGHTYVVDSLGRLIAFGDTGRVLKGEILTHLKDVADFIDSPGRGDQSGVNISTGINGRMMVGTYVPLIEPDWAVMTELPVREAYRPVMQGAVASAGMLLVMAILAALLGVMVAQRLAIPILNLADTATRIEAGEKDLQAAMVGPTEVIRLAAAFNNMTKRLRVMLVAEAKRSRKLAQEVDKRKKTQEALRESSSVLNATFESISDGVLVVTGNGQVSHYNSRFAELWSIPDTVLATGDDAAMIDYVSSQLVDPKGFETKIKELYQSASLSEDTLHFKDGRIVERFSYPLREDGRETGRAWFFRDVTERVRLEEMMIQSEKMLSIGGLAAGMAHEVNNPLAGIQQSASVLKNRLLGDFPGNHQAADMAGTTLATIRQYLELRKLPEMLDGIDTSCERAASIVRNMLGFARKSDRVHSIQDLGALLDQTIELARTDFDLKKQYDFKRIKIVKQFDATVAPVPCDPGKLQQVFLNILKNGAEAMVETPGDPQHPTITLRILDDGEWVRVEIEDNGPGMADKTRRSIFDPFFTTKPVGRGTGLGLSVSYFIITEDHGGELGAYKAEGGGTRFLIRLPKAGLPSPR
jgi:signal transduction histidine kinase